VLADRLHLTDVLSITEAEYKRIAKWINKDLDLRLQFIECLFYRKSLPILKKSSALL